MKAVVSSDQEGMAAFLQTGFLLSGEKIRIFNAF